MSGLKASGVLGFRVWGYRTLGWSVFELGGCVLACTYACMGVHACIYVCVRIYIYVCMYVCMCVCMCECVCVHVETIVLKTRFSLLMVTLN